MPSPAKTGVTTYATPSDREVMITRVVKAPRRIVFEAYTTPRHLQQWLLGPEGWTMPICEIDLRPGGAFRYVWRKTDGEEMTIAGAVREVAPPERLVTTESWGPEWPETVNTVVFTEAEDTRRSRSRCSTVAPRATPLQTGMKEGS
jgi:uncharacterized protein YndB with AHSA1/START domain